ncbi:MAG: alpha/beta hydrolase family protein [Eubacteriales bacterium]|jgi:pimeloyl-ACP methyl ester carboxylesterase
MAITISQSYWKEHQKIDFKVDNRESFIVVPKQPREDRRWVWRAEFFGAFDSADMALLQKGWYLAYHKCSDMYGCPESIEMFKKFHDTAVESFGFYNRAVMFGFSRGALYAFNYAAKYPDYISALYLDAPVLDIRSWPGGIGSAKTSPKEWKECMKWYGLNDETAMMFRENPLDKAEIVAKAGIPLIMVIGDADTDVPPSENANIMDKRFRSFGGKIEMITKPRCAHHPHSLKDPSPIVRFIEKFAL